MVESVAEGSRDPSEQGVANPCWPAGWEPETQMPALGAIGGGEAKTLPQAKEQDPSSEREGDEQSSPSCCPGQLPLAGRRGPVPVLRETGP